MSEKYIAFIPEDWQWQAGPEALARITGQLLEAGFLQGDAGDPATWRNGPATSELWIDTDPKPAVGGGGLGSDPGNMRCSLHDGALRGFAGDNLTPVACIHCESELPYEEAQDAFIALKEGVGVDDDRMKMECYHCGEHTPGVGADFGTTGGFASFALVYEGETSNRVEAVPAGLERLSAIVGTPMTWVQVHGW